MVDVKYTAFSKIFQQVLGNSDDNLVSLRLNK